ncbi:MAG: carboxypeptidase regulatory-like domain-containing protein [Cyclobacteriaceae bacterium]
MKKFNKLLTVTIILSLFIGVYSCNKDDDLPEAKSILSGTIKDALSGEGIPGATVAIIDENAGTNEVQTGSDGKFSFEGIVAGRHTIRISKPKYVTKELIKNIDKNLLITGAEASLMPYGHLAGRITAYESGQPVAGVAIRTNITGSKTSSDENGYYETPQLDDGTYNFSFTKSGYGVASQEFTITAGELTTGDIQLRQLGGLKGRVSDYETNEPISGVNIKISGDTNHDDITDQDGLYSFEGLTEGNYTVIATIGDYESETKEVSVKAGPPTPLNFQLIPSLKDLVVSNKTLDFGDHQDNISIVVSNSGRGALEWSIDEKIDYITVNPTSGVSTPSSPESVGVTVDRSNLIPSSEPYKTSFSINSTGGGSEQIDVIVKVKSSMKVYPGDINFSTTSKQQSFDIENTGNSPIEFRVTKNKDWMTISPTRGNLQPGDRDAISVQVDRNQLSPGTHDGEIAVNSDGMGSTKVNVQLVVPNSNAPQLTASPKELDFGTDFREKSIIISNTGQGDLEWQLSSLPEWLGADKSYGILSAGKTTNVKVTAFRQGLPAASYEERLTITSNVDDYYINAKMQVEDRPILNINTDFIDFGNSDVEKSFSISNAGTGELKWSILTNQPWLIAVPESGSGAGEVKIIVNREIVGIDNHQGLVTVRSNAGEDQTIRVNMQKTPPPPNLFIKEVELIADDNNTNEPNPGEKVTYRVTIANSSTKGVGQNVRAEISHSSRYIVSVTPQVNYGTIAVNSQEEAQITIEFSDNTPIREKIKFDVMIEDLYGMSWKDDFVVEVKSNHIVPEGLVAYYTFDDGNFTDKAGEFDLLNHGPELSTDVPNGTGLSIEFKAEEGDYLKAADNIIHNFTYGSFNFWIKTDTKDQQMYLFNASSHSVKWQNRMFIQKDNTLRCNVDYYKRDTRFPTDLSDPVTGLLDENWHS